MLQKPGLNGYLAGLIPMVDNKVKESAKKSTEMEFQNDMLNELK